MNKLEKVRLTDLCEVLSGGTPKTTNSDFWGGDIPWASVKDFNTGNRWFRKTDKTITVDGLNSCSSVLLQPGDLVLSARGTVGVVAQCLVPTAFNQSNYGIRAIEGVSDAAYLYYLVSSMREKLVGDSHGGMFDTITRETLNRVEVTKFSLSDQQMIGKVLGYFDLKIRVNQEIASTLENIAQTIFKSWFVDFDPVHAKARGEQPVGMDAETAALFPDSFEESELGPIPAGWKCLTLGDMIQPKKGKTITKATTREGDVPVVAGGLEPAYFHDTSNVYPPVITISASGANAGFVRLYTQPIWASDCTYISREQSDVVLFWLQFLKLNQARIYDMQQGGAQPHIYASDLIRLQVCAPEGASLLARFEALIQPMFEVIGVNTRENETLGDLRDSLLPRLISGELEIPAELLEV